MFRHHYSAVFTALETGITNVAERFRSVGRRGLFSLFTANVFQDRGYFKNRFSQWTLL